ncbi:carboxylesterase family protein, partial [Shewanella sp. A25]|nr:carboxylesterase family protein [Shewanella shenzhenensis]
NTKKKDLTKLTRNDKDNRPQTEKGDHGDEIFFVFGAPLLKEGASEEETNLSNMLMKFWSNYDRNGNHNGEGLPHWPEYY